MVNGIGSSSYNMQIMMQRPSPQDFFKKVDSDGSGGISQTEIKTLAEDIKSKTGNTFQVEDASFTESDTDGDGSLNASELGAFMATSGFGPPKGMEGMGGGAPPSQEQAVSAYSSNSGEDSLLSLIANLQKLLDTLQAAEDSQNSSASTTESIGTSRSRPDPRDFFNKVDADGSSGISKDELQTLADNLKKMTGKSIAIDDDTFAKLDGDGDGSLNEKELKTFMDESGFTPPPLPPDGMAMMRMSSDDSQDGSSSATLSKDDLISLFQGFLDKLKTYSAAKDNGSDSLLSVYS